MSNKLAPEFGKQPIIATFEIYTENQMGIEITLNIDKTIGVCEFVEIEQDTPIKTDDLDEYKHVRYDISDGARFVYKSMQTFHNVPDFIKRMRIALDTFEKLMELESSRVDSE